jgi:SecD/SecF fusion protein
MEKQRKWHFFLILTVIALTIYNISPTIFYYAKPLKEPLSESMALDLSSDIAARVNQLEPDAIAWLSSFCDLLHIKPAAISSDENNSQFLTVRFSKPEEASRLRHYLPRAGSLIPFAPAGLSLVAQNIQDNPKTVLVQRKIPIRLKPDLFTYADKNSSAYRQIILDRASQIGAGLAGATESALMIAEIEQKGPASVPMEWIHTLASQISALDDLPEGTPLYKRAIASFTQGRFVNRSKAIQALIAAFDYGRDEIKRIKIKSSGETLSLLEKQESSLIAATTLLKKHPTLFSNGQDPWSTEDIFTQLQSDPSIQFGSLHPLFASLSIDWGKETIQLKLHADIAKLRAKKTNEPIEQLLIHELAKSSRLTNELFVKNLESSYESSFHQNPETTALLVLQLDAAAKKISAELLAGIKANWHPKHPDLSEENFPIVDFATYQTLPQEQKALCLVAYAPSAIEGVKPAGIHNQSIYFLAKGIHRIAKNYEQFPHSELAKTFQADLQSLQELLRQHGFASYWGASFPHIEDLASDIVFEQRQFFSTLLAATRENFQVRGTNKYAFLELSNLEQRILTTNKIETQIHEELVKCNDEYRSASVSLDPALRYDVPKPNKNILWNNFTLNLRKMIRGDERKIIRWGLDLSGGKTVQLELRDTENRPVIADADLKQGISELYQRVSKMGVSEVSIRQIGHQIVLDFPGSQALSGSELVRASTMYFHIVNEKFSTHNPSLANTVNRFLEEVWNEAQVTFHTDPKSINEIAWRHLYNSGDPANPGPRSEAARTLLENGFQLPAPDDSIATNAFNDTISKIVIYRGSDSEWHSQSHPLLIVFRNYALEGSNLENIRSSYDPAKGNSLSFGVTRSAVNREGKKNNPRDDLQAWSTRFSKPKVAGTLNEAYSQGQGWRMAVVLNDSVISSPTLNDSLRDSAMISGSFSQREVTQLVSDLKAGSLTFTPHILSEKNVSPELGKTDRMKGITATFIALLLVIGSMIAYYRFAGLIASVAVVFNILIMWATLQNLGATLSLPGIAALILTVGMAVDANVLVFERIKEEFGATGHIASAIKEGYKKAFSAILDSNVTTIIAALILLNFDAGPIKAFAITLIIGIVSSLFTALFVTRFYFTGWVKNPKNTFLSMANWIHATKFNFLRWTKLAFAVSGAIILLGGYLAVEQRSTLLGMDFTGGFSLNLDMQQDEFGNYAGRVENALLAKGLNPQDFQIRELSPSNQLRVLFGTSLEQPKKMFADMPLTNDRKDTLYAYQKNPRIEWVAEVLSTQGLTLTAASLPHLHTNWTAMSGQMSNSMRNNALIGLLIAFVCIFFYIAVRFEYKFAIAASLCLLHDVLITLSLMGLLHVLGVPLQIDLNTIAALMTIIGYSLNDTIIVFDRIREDINNSPKVKDKISAQPNGKKNLFLIVNHALNATLSRTSITSGTTLLVLLALVLLGGSSIFSFALVMTIGVIFGTLSSWFIAAPLMLYFHKKEEESNSSELYTEKNSFEWKPW